jgi:hypothetical protein
MSDEPLCCSFCFNQHIPLFDGGFDPPVRICAFCPAHTLSEITPLPVAAPAPPPERPSSEAPLVADLDQLVIGQHVAKRRLSLG